MCSQIQQFPPLILSGIMSTSKDPQNFEQETAQLGNSVQLDSVPGQEIAPESEIAVRGKGIISTSGDHQKELLSEEITQKKEIDDEATGSSRNAENHPIEENDDGFKTPTSPGHRIPSPSHCPPAPRKPPPPKLKRKASSPVACRSLQFDEPAEVESIFRPVSDQDNMEETKIKKARRTKED